MASLMGHVVPFLAVIGSLLTGSDAFFPMHGRGMFAAGLSSLDGFADELMLTCSSNVTDPATGVVTDAITATISMADSMEGGYGGMGGGFGGMAKGGMGGMIDPFMGQGYGMGYGMGYGGMGHGGMGFGGMGHGGMGHGMGHGGFGGGYGGNQRQGGGLKAEIQLLSSAVGTGSIVFTRQARTEDGCSVANFGEILTPTDDSYDNGGGYGMHGMGFGYPGMMGLMGMERENSGIIRGGIRVNMNMQTIFIDNLEGFNRLEDLAGRGLVICSGSDMDWNWQATCEGPYFGCCTLKYDSRPQSINMYHNFDGNLPSPY